MIIISSLIRLSFNHISKMQHFIKILTRKADHFLKYFFSHCFISEKRLYMIDSIMSYDDTKSDKYLSDWYYNKEILSTLWEDFLIIILITLNNLTDISTRISH